jgi:hypothetical protein
MGKTWGKPEPSADDDWKLLVGELEQVKSENRALTRNQNKPDRIPQIYSYPDFVVPTEMYAAILKNPSALKRLKQTEKPDSIYLQALL